MLSKFTPAALRYSSDLAERINRKKKATGCKPATETSLVKRISECCERLYEASEQLQIKLQNIPQGNQCAADYCSNIIVPDMQAVRKEADLLEKLTAKSYWPYPTYSDPLFY